MFQMFHTGIMVTVYVQESLLAPQKTGAVFQNHLLLEPRHSLMCDSILNLYFQSKPKLGLYLVFLQCPNQMCNDKTLVN